MKASKALARGTSHAYLSKSSKRFVTKATRLVPWYASCFILVCSLQWHCQPALISLVVKRYVDVSNQIYVDE